MNKKHDWDQVLRLYNDGTSMEDIMLLVRTHPGLSQIRYILSKQKGLHLNASKRDGNEKRAESVVLPDIPEDQMSDRARRLLRQAREEMEPKVQYREDAGDL